MFLPCTQQTRHKHLLFRDVQEGFLESYLPGSPKNYVPGSDTKKFKAVSSLENEVCLFPPSMSDESCTDIAYLMCLQRQL